jgi:hypothetical protein
MIDLSQLIYVKRNAVSKETCDYLISKKDTYETRWRKEVADHAVKDKYEEVGFESVICRPEHTMPFKILHGIFEKYTKEYADYIDTLGVAHSGYRKYIAFSHEYRLLEYAKGSSVIPHIDGIYGVYGSFSINLNDDYEGGLFSFFNGQYKVELGVGDIIIFPVNHFSVHEVEEVTAGTRYSFHTLLHHIPYLFRKEIEGQIERKLEDYDFKNDPLWYDLTPK